MIDRLQLANEIINVIETESQGVDVYLRGSLATDATDDFSDIDIGVQCSNKTDKVLSTEIIDLMQKRYDLLFFD